MVLYLKNLQPSVDDAVAQSEIKTKIDAATLTTLEKHGNEVGGHAAEHDDHEGEEGRGHDPHIWLDPVKYAEVAEGVGKAFEKDDPDNAADYKKQHRGAGQEAGRPQHPVRGRAQEHQDARSSSPPTPPSATSPSATASPRRPSTASTRRSEPSANRVKDLETMAKADGVTTVFYETLVSDKTAKTIADGREPQDRRPRPDRGHHRASPGRRLPPGHGVEPEGAARRLWAPNDQRPSDRTQHEGRRTRRTAAEERARHIPARSDRRARLTPRPARYRPHREPR